MTAREGAAAPVAGSPGLGAQRPAPALGLAIAFGSATCYTVATICATLTYPEGGNPVTLIWLRFLIAAVVLGLLARATRRSLRIPRSAFAPLAATALGTIGMTNGYLGSIAFIPIELAVLIFYTFPLLVGTAEALLERRPLGWGVLLLYLLAFGGLALALGPSFAELDWRGILLACVASFSAVLAMLGARAVARRMEPLAVACQANLLGFLCMCVLMPATGGLALPVTDFGWLNLILACSIFVVAFFGQVLSVRYASAGAVAMMYNFEPALTVLIAWLWLGGTLGLGQALGVALILLVLLVAPRVMRR